MRRCDVELEPASAEAYNWRAELRKAAAEREGTGGGRSFNSCEVDFQELAESLRQSGRLLIIRSHMFLTSSSFALRSSTV